MNSFSSKVLKSEVLQNRISIDWEDGHHSDFHFIWLRDNCVCTDCLHPSTHERTLDILEVDPDISPKFTAIDDEKSLKIIWAKEDHLSSFDLSWLRDNCYSDSAKASRYPAPTLWEGDLIQNLPEIEYEQVMSDDAGLLLWLQQMQDFGLSFIRNTPDQDDEVEKVARRISFLRETNFGVGFDVISKPNPNNVAYTPIELHPHSDLPNREMPPGTQFLHCLEANAIGGESTLVDGFAVARALSEKDEEAYSLLTSLPVPFRFHDDDWDLRWKGPTINLDHEGNFQDIRYHAALTAPLDIEPELVEPFYRAYRIFGELLRSVRYQIEVRLMPGDIMVFNNRRVLHGRKAFDPNTGARKLQGCYVDNDELFSRLRLLEHSSTIA